MQQLIAGLRAAFVRHAAADRLRRLALHPYTLLAAAALGVWLPRGFNIGPVNDCWFQLAAVLGDGGFLRDSVTRVFGALPMWLGMQFGDGGFQGVQAVMLALAWARAVLFLEIVRRLLPGRPLMALAAGLIALFPFSDNSYFWLGASGLQFSLVTALAACLCALEYLARPRRSMLLAALALQLLSAFTYPGFLPLMACLPALGWALQRRSGRPVPVRGLLWLNATLLAAVLVYGLFLLDNTERNAQVLEPSISGFFQGYAWAGAELMLSPLRVLLGSRYGAPVVVLCALYAWKVAVSRPATGEGARDLSTGYWSWLIAGLLALAALSYLPYAFTTVRYAGNRALLGAGIFFYTALACGLLALLERVRVRQAAPLAMLVLAGMVVWNGLQKRDVWVRPYRAQEAVFSAVARALPRPAAGDFVLVRLEDARQAKDIQGIYSREAAFSIALQYLYHNHTVMGGFYGGGTDRVQYLADGLQPRGSKYRRHRSNGLIPYGDLIVLDYPRDRPAHVLTPAELAADTGVKPSMLSGYEPPGSDEPAAPGALMCRMLEPAFRPPYCGP